VALYVQIGVFNHTSWVDAVAVMYLFAPSGVSKESNAHLPLVGTCIRSFQNIYVSRASIELAKRRDDVPSVAEKIATRCAIISGPLALSVSSTGTERYCQERAELVLTCWHSRLADVHSWTSK